MKKQFSFIGKITGLLLLFSFFAANIFAQSNVQKLNVETYKLPNGFTVYLLEDHLQPIVRGYVTTKAGSINDPAEATGLAHYLEHMMFKGTTTMSTMDWEKEKPHYDKIVQLYDELGKTKDKKAIENIQKQINEESLKAAQYSIPNEIVKLINEMGGIAINASTSRDVTRYQSTAPSSQIERWLSLYSHIFEQPVFRAFQSELETVYEEYNMYQDMSSSRMNDEYMDLMFKKIPYGRPIIGYAEHLKQPSLTKLQEFFNTYYVAGNMALVLVGDFNSSDVKPMIENTFGKWPAKTAPALTMGKEDPFKGREYKEIKVGPREMAMVTFRTVPAKDPDNLVLDVCSGLMSNGQSGLLDQLVNDNKILSGYFGSNSLKYDGIVQIQMIPNAAAYYDGPDPNTITTADGMRSYRSNMDRARIKAMDACEKLALAEVQKLADGKFNDWQLDAVKQSLINSYKRAIESVDFKAQMLTSVFSNELNLDDYINYVEKVKAITKDDVMRIAKKYFGKDYSSIQVKPGSFKKNTIEKPSYKPLVFPNAEGESVYAKQFKSIKTPEIKSAYIDFNNDIQRSTLNNGNKLYYTKNPVNDLFSLLIRFEVGTASIKELEYVGLLNYGGAGARNAKALKDQFARLNCNYSVNSSDSYVYISLNGPDQNLRQALDLLNTFITEPNISKNQVTAYAERERFSRKREKTEANIISSALESYVIYGDKSDYIDRLSLNNILKIKPEDVITAFRMAHDYSATVFYSGSRPMAEVKNQLDRSIKFVEKPLPGKGVIVKDLNEIKENVVYFINQPSLQAQITLFANGNTYNVKDDPQIRAFNTYFSNGFMGLVTQEIREYNSMAYGAGASYSTPGLPGKPCSFTGTIKTQDDKTIGALDLFMGLVRDMPQKTDREKFIKEYLTNSAFSSRPTFRNVAQIIEGWERVGYTEDPLKTTLPAYNGLTFNTITQFWESNIKNKPFAITIVGDKKNINLKELSKFGKVVELKASDIFSTDDE